MSKEEGKITRLSAGRRRQPTTVDDQLSRQEVLTSWETMIYLKRPNCFCLMNVDLDAALLIWLPNLNSKWALAMKLIESNHSGGLSHG